MPFVGGPPLSFSVFFSDSVEFGVVLGTAASQEGGSIMALALPGTSSHQVLTAFHWDEAKATRGLFLRGTCGPLTLGGSWCLAIYTLRHSAVTTSEHVVKFCAFRTFDSWGAGWMVS